MRTTVPLVRRAAAAALGGLMALTLTATASPASAAPVGIDGTEPTGPRLGVSFLGGTTVFRPDGSQVRMRLPFSGRRLADFVDLGDRVVVLGSPDGRTTRVYVVSDAGAVLRSEATSSSRLVANDDASAAAWLSPTQRVRVSVRRHTGLVTLAAVPGVRTWEATALQGQDCAVSCLAFVDTAAGARYTRTGGRTGSVPGFRVVTHADQRFRGGGYQPAGTQGFPCGKVVRVAGHATTWKGCDWLTDTMDVAGRYSLQIPSGTDGPGPRTVRFLGNATGTAYATFTSRTIQDAVWEDGDHVIATVLLPGTTARWAMYRLGVDGSAVRVSSIQATGDDAISPWRLAAS
ncbi:hypothetical protein GCM10027425_32920 [Alteromonas gracilis]